MRERHALQLSIAIAAALPVGAGLWGIVHGASTGTWTDNHHRYLSGLLLAIGLGYWSTVPGIEAMGARLGFLTALVVTGGLARLAGVTLGDVATPSVIAALVMELLVAPLLCLWRARIVSRSRRHFPGIARLEPYLGHIAP